MQSIQRVVEQRIPPVRGLVLTCNGRGQAFDLIDVKRWFRLCAEVYKVLKCDLLVTAASTKHLRELATHAAEHNVRLSVRTDCSWRPEAGVLAELGLLDVFLTPCSPDMTEFSAWMDEARSCGLPVRVQVQPPLPSELALWLDALSQPEIVSVNVALHDPFVGCTGAYAADTVQRMNELASLLKGRGVETNLLRLPFCHVDAGNLDIAENDPQFFLDHQQYHRLSYTLARRLWRRSPGVAARALVVPLGRNKSASSQLDERLLPWLVENPWVHTKLLMWRRFTRKARALGLLGRPIEGGEPAHERELARIRAAEGKQLGPCAGCRFRRLCDKETPEFSACLPGLGVTPQPGELVVSPLHFLQGQGKWYDAVDAARLEEDASRGELAERARQIVFGTLPSREVVSEAYEIDGQWTHHMPGGNRWYAFTNGEKLSTPLARTEAPFTISLMLGGGIAELAGFSFGRHSKVLCPMDAFSHQLILHVERDGRYVLLRDGKPMRPVEFEQAQLVPVRLPGVLEPRISLWNIDGSIVTQTVQVWEGAPAAAATLSHIKYSVFIVTTRYARRLQAVLMSLARQRDFDLSALEVIIGYVPGLDATEDVIDSFQQVYPGLRIVRAPFQESYAKSKGFLINESVRLASGEWVVLLDSDTLVGPDMFARMDAVSEDVVFIAPDGRKMLTPQTTAEILLGRIQPSEQWEALLQGEGEFRAREADGVPIGFFQAARKTCLERIRYEEMDHFEGADWIFGYAMRKAYGTELRLTGAPVIHLDHGGSQWYGTSKHR